MVFSTLNFKHMKYLITAFILSSFLFLSCKKIKEDVLKTSNNNTSYAAEAAIKFVNSYAATTPTGGATGSGPSVDIYVNNNKINATAVSYGSTFPAPAAYASVSALPNTSIKVVLNRAGTSNPNSDILYNGNFFLIPGTYSTLFLVDTFPYVNVYSPNGMVVNDSLTSAKEEFHQVRFANMMATTDALEVYSKNYQRVILGGTYFKNVSRWVELPLIRKVDTLQLRRVGTTTVLAELRPFQAASQRVYTVFSRGDINTASGTRPRTLSVFTNK
jgi:Domain of unknown function (DUF4397)